MASLLPTGETTFFDANGVPLASGTVEFYIPGTTTPKDTWQNSAQTILNPNPVTLDSAGRAIIYGSGSYRQVVKDSLGNLVWDQETAEPNSGAVSFGGTSGGTANAQTLSASQFSYGDGQIISFVAGLSNTGATTISVGGGAPIAVLKNGPAGPVALASGDIVAGNSYFIQYSAQLSSFQLLLSVAPSTPTGPFLRGYLWGLTLSNNAGDPTNSIDITTGAAASDGATPVLMSLASGLTKVANVAWAVGTGNGWLDTGAIGNGWYYAYIIARSDTGVVDSLLSLSATAPTMPGSYDRKRRIGALFRTAGSFVTFIQDGDFFEYKAPTADITTISTTPTLRTIKAPTAFSVMARIGVQIANTAGVMPNANHWDPSLGSTLPSTRTGVVQMFANTPSFAQATSVVMDVRTNSSGQIYTSTTGGGLTGYNLETLGYFDSRGRLN